LISLVFALDYTLYGILPNYIFDSNEIIIIDSIVSETLTSATVADAQWRTGIIVVEVFCVMFAVIFSNEEICSRSHKVYRKVEGK
jgi:hypothetical protein